MHKTMQEALESINICQTRRGGANLTNKTLMLLGGEHNCSLEVTALGLLTT